MRLKSQSGPADALLSINQMLGWGAHLAVGYEHCQVELVAGLGSDAHGLVDEGRKAGGPRQLHLLVPGWIQVTILDDPSIPLGHERAQKELNAISSDCRPWSAMMWSRQGPWHASLMSQELRS